MFTGLIEEVGAVAEIQQTPAGAVIKIQAQTILEDTKIGDSIAIDGVCTTVVELDLDTFTIEASPETLRKTTFKNLQPQAPVNLERPLTPQSRIGGHFVTGHVDGLATITSKVPEGNSVIFEFELEDKTLAPYIIPKGSITVAGISLTVNTLQQDRFTVAIIPHTLFHTNLNQFQVGDTLNIETDMLGKYVQQFLKVPACV